MNSIVIRYLQARMKTSIHVHRLPARAALLFLSLVMLVPAYAASPDRTAVDRLVDAIVTMMPAGAIMENFAGKDPAWPMGSRARSVDASQLACIRKELSVDGYRRFVESEVQAYADRHEATLESDAVLAEAVAPIFGDIMMAKMQGREFDRDAQMAKLSAKQMLDFMTFAYDPKYADLRLLSGYGDIPAEGATNKDNGVIKLMLTRMTLLAMGRCDISPGQIF